MKRRGSSHLLVLLSGLDKGVIGRGPLRRGKVVRETRGRLVAAAPQMAMSDGPAPSGYPTLVGHPVAVIIFAAVVNRHYLNSAAAKDTLRGADYTPCVDRQVSLPTTLCAASAAEGA